MADEERPYAEDVRKRLAAAIGPDPAVTIQGEGYVVFSAGLMRGVRLNLRQADMAAREEYEELGPEERLEKISLAYEEPVRDVLRHGPVDPATPVIDVALDES